MTTTLSPAPVFKGWDNNGAPLAGGKLFTYGAGGTTKQPTFTDSGGLTANANPTILDYRGEARVWINPNVGYKYVLAPPTDTDPPTNPIWSVDNLVNSQLITLYGGVDSGIANAYVLTFPANFTSYVDGTIIYWIPSHTNTGPSTININGLGIVAIVNPDGSALLPGEIIVNQPTQILAKGGVFQLITPSAAITGSFTCTWAGFSVNPGNTTIAYRRTGNLVALTFPAQTGTSNGGGFTLGALPAILTPLITSQVVPCLGLVDNGATVVTPSVAVVLATGTISFWKDSSFGVWTSTGAKGFNPTFMATIVYAL